MVKPLLETIQPFYFQLLQMEFITGNVMNSPPPQGIQASNLFTFVRVSQDVPLLPELSTPEGFEK